MKTVLITGAGGFIGSHLSERCVELGFKVKAFIRYNSRNNWGWLETSAYKKEIEVIPGDIRDFDSVVRAMKNVHGVFHLAALIGIPYSYVSPLAYIRTNIEGTYNILQAGRDLGTEKILITSTSEVYGTAQYVPIDENHPVVAQSPYSATKISADNLALSFYRSFAMPVSLVRPFNTFGPRQSARAFIPTVITQILNGQRRISLGNLHPTRDFTFVKDTVNGFVEIANSGIAFGEVTNIGMKEEISMFDLVRKIAKLMNVDVQLHSENDRVRPDKSEVERLCCDNRKIIQNTKWRPGYTLETGLAETIKWIEENRDVYKPDSYVV
jgi:NAD dependent epimerase/dehydratase